MRPGFWNKIYTCACGGGGAGEYAHAFASLRTVEKPIHSRCCRGWNKDILKIFHHLRDDSGHKTLKSLPLLPCFHTIRLLGKRGSESVGERWSDGWKFAGTTKIPPLRSSLRLQQPRTHFHQTNHSLCPIRPAYRHMTDSSLWAKEEREK